MNARNPVQLLAGMQVSVRDNKEQGDHLEQKKEKKRMKKKKMKKKKNDTKKNRKTRQKEKKIALMENHALLRKRLLHVSDAINKRHTHSPSPGGCHGG